MFCTQCGNEVKPGQLFCTSCGAKIVAPVQNEQNYQNSQSCQNNQSYQGYQNDQSYQGYQSNQTYQGYQNYQQYGNYTNYKVKKKNNALVGLLIALGVIVVIGAIGSGAYLFYKGTRTKVEAGISSEDTTAKESENSTNEQTASVEPANNSNDTAADPDDLFAGYKNLEYKNYSFAGVAYGEKALYVVPSGYVNDNTVLRDGKTAGEFADFIDNEVLEDGRVINRKLLYDLISVYLVDPSLSNDPGTFAKSMIYLTTFANQFYEMDVDIEAMSVPFTEQNRYRFKVKSYGNDDIWIADPTNNEFYFNNGKTEYSSSMYDDYTLTLWLTAVEVFFGMEKS